MQALLYAYALLAGVLNPVHTGFNATISKSLGSPSWAALVSVVVAGLALAAIGIALGQLAWPGAKTADVPWWAWGSGLLEAVIVLSQPVVARRIGSGAYAALLITATVATSIVLDHLGLLGFEQRSATVLRLAGAGLMIGGMLLVAIF